MNFLLRRRGLGNTSCNAVKTLSKTGIEVVRNDRAIPEGEVVFRWGCTSNVKARVIVNPAKAIHIVTDKTEFRRILDREGLCPKTYFYGDDVIKPTRLIIRPQYHHQGRHLYDCNTAMEVQAAWGKVGRTGYAGEFIDKIAEYRVFVVQGRVVAVASKLPPEDKRVAWNVAQGGKFENVRWGNWPIEVVRVAIEAFNLSGLDFGGVDVMEDKAGKGFVLEINSAPSLTSPYRQACMTKAFDWIVKNGKAPIPLDNHRKSYGKYIHPAVDGE